MIHRKKEHYSLKLLLSVGQLLLNFIMSWGSSSHSFMVPFAAWALKSLPFTFLRCNLGVEGAHQPQVSKDLSSTVSWTSFSHVPWWIQALAKREAHIWETWNGQQMQNLPPGNAWRRQRDDRLWKRRRIGSCRMRHRWGNPRRTAWGGRDVIKEIARDDYQRDGMAFVKIRGKEVPAWGLGDADGLRRARQQRQHVQSNEPELNINVGDELTFQ